MQNKNPRPLLDLNEKQLSWTNVLDLCRERGPKGKAVWGIPRGGAIIAGILEMVNGCKAVQSPTECQVIVDDIVETGKTKEEAKQAYPQLDFWAPITKQPGMAWIRFPWEHDSATEGEDNVVRLLEMIGEDPKRDGLRDTPARYVRALQELTKGQGFDAATLLDTKFSVEHQDEMVVLRDLEFWSLCEHHLLPFHGTATVGYIPKAKKDGKYQVVGLSKLARLVDCVARRLQIQEAMTYQIASHIHKGLDALGAGCIIRARHTCMAMRGIQKNGEMVTSALLGVFRDDPKVKAEFLGLDR